MEVPGIKKRAAVALASLHWKQQDIALALGYANGSSICQMGVRRAKRADERLPDMIALYRAGKTLGEIGAVYGITRERVRQLLSGAGISSEEGGSRARAQSRSAAAELRRVRQRNARAMSVYGCDYETAVHLNNGESLMVAGTRSRFFYQQRTSARTRCISWELTFPQWCAIWDESGKWEQRGRGKNRYCMSRNGDSGAYAVGNVSIVLNEVNIAESYIHTPASARRHAVISRRVENQRKALLLKSAGMRNVDIARHLGLSACTIAQYLVNGKRGEIHA